VHRLTATLAFLIRLSPLYQDQLVPLLSVPQVGRGREAEIEKKGNQGAGGGGGGAVVYEHVTMY